MLATGRPWLIANLKTRVEVQSVPFLIIFRTFFQDLPARVTHVELGAVALVCEIDRCVDRVLGWTL